MNSNDAVDDEINKVNWSALRESTGSADNIPMAIRELLSACSPGESKKAYWKIENHVVVQGGLYSSAFYVISVLMTALIDEKPPKYVRIVIIELLFQILNGYPHPEDKSEFNADIDVRCKDKAKENMWILERELMNDKSSGAKEIIDLLKRG